MALLSNCLCPNHISEEKVIEAIDYKKGTLMVFIR